MMSDSNDNNAFGMSHEHEIVREPLQPYSTGIDALRDMRVACERNRVLHQQQHGFLKCSPELRAKPGSLRRIPRRRFLSFNRCAGVEQYKPT